MRAGEIIVARMQLCPTQLFESDRVLKVESLIMFYNVSMSNKKRRAAVRRIVQKIESSMERLAEKSIPDVAGYIVGDTWCDDVDVMEFESDYPELIAVADLAADLEVLEEDSQYVHELWRSLLINFEILKEKVAKDAERKE